jgi:hypothetical protein
MAIHQSPHAPRREGRRASPRRNAAPVTRHYPSSTPLQPQVDAHCGTHRHDAKLQQLPTLAEPRETKHDAPSITSGYVARSVRVIEYDVPDREGDGKDELIVLVTTITDFRAATAQALAGAYQQRWEHEAGNAQLKTYLRGPGRVLRSGSPDLIEQEIWATC